MYLLGDAPRAGGYIVLTKEGYAVEHKVRCLPVNLLSNVAQPM